MHQCKEAECHIRASVRGWCRGHYQRWYYGRAATGVIKVYKTGSKPPRPSQPCVVDGCVNAREARGLCPRHYARMRKHGDPLVVKTREYDRVIPNETSPTKLAKLLGVSRQRAHQILNKQAHNARKAVYDALIQGRISKPESCERCDARTADLEAHHWDYREELDVRWVCKSCHMAIHVQIRKQNAA